MLEEEEEQFEMYEQKKKRGTKDKNALSTRKTVENASLKKKKSKADDLAKQIEELSEQRNDAMEQRKEVMSNRRELERKLKDQEDMLKKCEKDLRYSMDKSIWRGLQNVKRLVEEQNIKGYHGPLIEVTINQLFVSPVVLSQSCKFFSIFLFSSLSLVVFLDKSEGQQRRYSI